MGMSLGCCSSNSRAVSSRVYCISCHVAVHFKANRKQRFEIDPSSYFHSRKSRFSKETTNCGAARSVDAISGRSRRDIYLGTVIRAELLEKSCPSDFRAIIND